jgi:1,4-alpha-glucan branching enzyme
VVHERLVALRGRLGRPGLTVAAFDTELFGHWWHEGPAWLEAVLRALPEAGVRVATLRGAAAAGLVGAPVALPASSWGSGKDWRVWAGPQVADLVAQQERVQKALLGAVAPGLARDPIRDALATEALLALSSDWAFMVSKDSAAGYARERASGHAARVEELAGLLGAGRRRAAERHIASWGGDDAVFGHLDARGLPTTS